MPTSLKAASPYSLRAARRHPYRRPPPLYPDEEGEYTPRVDCLRFIIQEVRRAEKEQVAKTDKRGTRDMNTPQVHLVGDMDEDGGNVNREEREFRRFLLMNLALILLIILRSMLFDIFLTYLAEAGQQRAVQPFDVDPQAP